MRTFAAALALVAVLSAVPVAADPAGASTWYNALFAPDFVRGNACVDPQDPDPGAMCAAVIYQPVLSITFTAREACSAFACVQTGALSVNTGIGPQPWDVALNATLVRTPDGAATARTTLVSEDRRVDLAGAATWVDAGAARARANWFWTGTIDGVEHVFV